MNVRKFLFLNQDIIEVLFYFIVVVIIIHPLINILLQSWVFEDGLMQQCAAFIRQIDSSGLSIFIALSTGIYFGLLFLLLLDIRKRVQAILILVGIIIILIYIINGQIFPNIIWKEYIHLVGLGIVVGIILGDGVGVLKNKKEFPKSAKYLSIFSAIFILFTFMNYYIPYLLAAYTGTNSQLEGSFFNDFIIILIFIYFFGRLVNRTIRGPKFFVLGPSGSGKSLFLAGCYLEAMGKTNAPLEPSQDLIDFCDELMMNKTWPMRTGATIKEYYFTYVTGKLLPKYTEIKTIDYPGGYLEIGKISEYLKKINENPVHIKDNSSFKGDKEESRYRRIAQEIIQSNKLVFILDSAKFNDIGEMGINEYFEIHRQINIKNKYIEKYIVVTKCDVFMNEFKSDPKNQNIDIKTNHGYIVFRKFIEKKFSDKFKFKQLKDETSHYSFYPVFYYTRWEENGFVPQRDENGNVWTYGFGNILYDLTQ